MANTTVSTTAAPIKKGGTPRPASQAGASTTAPTDGVAGQVEQPGVPSRTSILKGMAPLPADASAADKAKNLSEEQKQAEIKKRLMNDCVIELVGGDLPGLASMFANSPTAAAVMAPILLPLNIFNAATGFVGMINDGLLTSQTMANPAGTRMDKAVDMGHFLTTLGSGISDFVPVFDTAMNSHPVSMILFNGGQLLGLVGDVLHTRYDFKRGGAQSHVEGDEKARARYAIQSDVEKTISKTLQGAGSLGVWAQAFNHTLGMPADLLSSMTTLGGSAGLMLGAKQVNQAKGLRTSLLALKEQGVESLRFPVNTRHGAGLKEISMEEALKRADSMQRWGRAEQVSGAATMAAGITGMHLICLGAFAGGIGLAAAGAGVVAYKLLPQPAKDQVDKVLKPIAHAAHEVAEWAQPVIEPIDKAIDFAVEKTTAGLRWAGHKAAEGMQAVGRGVKKTYHFVTPEPVQEVLAKAGREVIKGYNATELAAYHGAVHVVDGVVAAGTATKKAGIAVGHYTQAHAPAVADAAVWAGHKAQAGLQTTARYTNKALGNDIEEPTIGSTAPAALPEGEE